MQEQTTMEIETETQVKQLRRCDDEGIDCSDIPELTKEKLLYGKIRFPVSPAKRSGRGCGKATPVRTRI